MKTQQKICIILTFALVLCAGPVQARQGRDDSPGSYKAGEVLVKYRDGATAWEKERARGRVRALKAKRLKRSGVERITIGPAMNVGAAVRALEEDPLVEYAEPNWKVRWLARVEPDDPQFTSQWYLDTPAVQGSIGQNTYDMDVDIDAPEGWGIMASAFSAPEEVSVGVLDSGLSESGFFSNSVGFVPSHEDHFNSLVFVKGIELPGTNPPFDNDGNGLGDDASGWDWIENDNAPADTRAPDDMLRKSDDFHGTLVSGIIGAGWNNSTGISGIGRDSLYNLPLRTLYISDIEEGVRYAIFAVNSAAANNTSYGDPPPRVLNASFEIVDLSNNPIDSPTLRAAIASAGEAGIVFVAAAGNLGKDNDIWPTYPANYSTTYSNVLAVGATGMNGGRASFSNYGQNSVQIAAPGATILSTYRDFGLKYEAVDGTSFSAPIAAAVLGLLMAAHPSLAPDQVMDRLIQGGDFDARLAGLVSSGKRVNLAGALAPFYPWSGLVPMDAASLPVVMYTDTVSSQYGTIMSAVSSSNSVATINTTSARSLEIDGISPGSATFTVAFQRGPVAEFVTGPWRVTAINPFSARTKTGSFLQFSSPLSAFSSSLTWEITDGRIGLMDSSTGNFLATAMGRTRVILKDAGQEVDRSGWIVVDYNPLGGGTGGGGGGGCFIATAAYGSHEASSVKTLRRFRDSFLLPYGPGRWFVDQYYRYSPPAARWLEQHHWFRPIARGLLMPAVLSAWLFLHLGPIASALTLVSLMMAMTLIVWKWRVAGKSIQ